MQILDATPQDAPATEVLDHSLVFDLSWCVLAAFSEELRARHPVVARLYAERDDLRRRVVEFWPDDVPCTVESEVLAFHGGVLDAVDVATYRAGCEAALATVPTEPDLGSETDEIRAITWRRLRQLRDSPDLADRYFTLLTEVWAQVAPWWDTVGRPAAEQAAAEARRALAAGREWTSIATASCAVYEEHLPDILDLQQHGHRVVLAPCALLGQGLYLELPGCTVVGLAAADRLQAARARTAHLVGPLRALADPTRLAIYDTLRTGPSTVGELATVCSLSQPTVSMHVKRLRDAGLVTSVRRGTRTEITVEVAGGRRLATQLAEILAP